MALKEYIENRFGSKRGLLHLCLAEAARHMGFYKAMSQIDFQKVNRLVFICHGNICRSPLGEAVAKALGVSAESYGLDTRGGDNADSRAVTFALQKEVILSHHITRHIKEYEPKSGDLLIGMEPKHTNALKALYYNKAQITLAGLWLQKPVAYLHDPYSANTLFFNLCESMVEQAAKTLAAKVNSTK
jgi:protein-tyrosine phosphatase